MTHVWNNKLSYVFLTTYYWSTLVHTYRRPSSWVRRGTLYYPFLIKSSVQNNCCGRYFAISRHAWRAKATESWSIRILSLGETQSAHPSGFVDVLVVRIKTEINFVQRRRRRLSANTQLSLQLPMTVLCQPTYVIMFTAPLFSSVITSCTHNACHCMPIITPQMAEIMRRQCTADVR